MIECEVHRTQDDDWLRVYCPYNIALVNALKKNITQHARRWDPLQRCWLVLVSERVALNNTLIVHGYLPQYIEHAPLPAPPAPPGKVLAEPIEVLFQQTPQALQRKLYRGLTLAFHPDNGGNEALMKRLNIVWERMGRGEKP